MRAHTSEETDVVVIGGGLAGLTSAVALVERGVRVLVLERASQLGGRAASWVDETTGDPVHIGPHIFMSHYPNVFQLFDRLGTRRRIVWQQRNRFITIVDGQREIVMRSATDLPPPCHFVPSLLADPRISLGDLASNWKVVGQAIEFDESKLAQIDELDARSFLEGLGVTPRFVSQFWEFTAMAILNVPLERCSAAALLRFYHHLISHSDLEIGFADGGLGDLYAPQARAYIEARGGVVCTDAAVAALAGEGDEVTGVVLADGRTVRARSVVAALPPQALRLLARPGWERHALFANLERFTPVPYVSVFLWFDRKLTDLQFWARSLRPGDLNCDFYDLSNIHSGWYKRPSLITSNIIYSHRVGELSDAEVVRRTIAELSEFLPEAAVARLRHAVVNRIPMAIHEPRPGTESRRPPNRTPIDGLFVAGDWTRTELPASMESAAASGWRVAEELLAERGIVAELVRAMPPPHGLTPLLRQWSRLTRRARPSARESLVGS